MAAELEVHEQTGGDLRNGSPADGERPYVQAREVRIEEGRAAREPIQVSFGPGLLHRT